jgi:hypothetical protein
MKWNGTIFLVALCLTLSLNAQPNIWVNEFHYDNQGGDVDEFIEVVVPVSFTDLSNVTLTLYNGSSGGTYGVSHTLDTFTEGSTSFGFKIYSKLINNIQNGSPDGFSLDYSGTVIQFLSYEGSFTATAGPASGETSVDIGVSESGSTPVGSSLQLVGSGTQYSDFTWSADPAPHTRGQPNNDGVNDQILPVELSSFTAIAGDGKVVLKWATASEINNESFEILRSSDPNGNYTVIGQRPGEGNTSQLTHYSFEDKLVANGTTYWYKLVDIDVNGVRTEHGPIAATPQAAGIEVTTINSDVPSRFRLYPAYPNPFNPSTNLRFDIPGSSRGKSNVRVEIFNSLGQRVRGLVNANLTPGIYKITWDAKNDSGQQLPGGVYYAVMATTYSRETVKLILVK